MFFDRQRKNLQWKRNVREVKEGVDMLLLHIILFQLQISRCVYMYIDDCIQ